MTKVVLTGFGPFGSVAVNPAHAGVLDAGMALYTDDGVQLVVEILPVEFDRARERVRALAASVEPDVWVSFGVAEERSVVTPERVAHNEIDARIPDNAGARPVGVPVDADGPATLQATLPTEAILTALAESGVAAEASDSAGRYVCNAVLYTALRALEGSGARVGFVHLPPGLPEPNEAVKTVVRAVVAAGRNPEA